MVVLPYNFSFDLANNNANDVVHFSWVQCPFIQLLKKSVLTYHLSIVIVSLLMTELQMLFLKFKNKNISRHYILSIFQSTYFSFFFFIFSRKYIYNMSYLERNRSYRWDDLWARLSWEGCRQEWKRRGQQTCRGQSPEKNTKLGEVRFLTISFFILFQK